MMAAAHDQKLNIRLVVHYPNHEPRETDSHYALFNHVRNRMAKAGKLVCWRCGSKERPEVHHTLEFSLANAVDVARFEALNPELHIADEEQFLAWMESEGNFTVLCMDCHRGPTGIHFCPYPVWVAGRYCETPVVSAVCEKE